MSDANWNACLAFVLAAEGGYVDDPLDPGGATNWGITRDVLAAWRHEAVTSQDVQALGRAEAAAIYQANYWNVTRCHDLPSGADLLMLDAAVNLGCGRAAKLLQNAVGVAADGAIGPATLAAVNAMAPAALIPALVAARASFYRGLATFAHFGTGWMARLDKAAALANKLAGVQDPATVKLNFP